MSDGWLIISFFSGLFCFWNIEVGEAVRNKLEQDFQHDKTRALLATEEIVRREEQLICQSKLQNSQKEWLIEKDKILEERKKHEIQEVAKQTEILREKLTMEFEAAKIKMEVLNQENIKERLEKARISAEKDRKQAVSEAREEEKKIAETLSIEMQMQFEEEKKQELQEQHEKTQNLLHEQAQRMNNQCKKEKNLLVQKLNKEHSENMCALKRDHESELQASQQVYYDLVLENKKIMEDLRETIDDRDYWKKKYEDLKLEFSDFVDQFPGFKGEFLIK